MSCTWGFFFLPAATFALQPCVAITRNVTRLHPSFHPSFHIRQSNSAAAYMPAGSSKQKWRRQGTEGRKKKRGRGTQRRWSAAALARVQAGNEAPVAASLMRAPAEGAAVV